jgi:Domain of unknown function (DUF4181)
MVVTIAFIVIILSLTNWILKKWVTDMKNEELSDEGKKVNRWVKIILSTICVISVVFFLNLEILDSDAMKWFWMIVILAAVGSESFIEWKYLKGSKQYLISLIVLFLGEILVYLLL